MDIPGESLAPTGTIITATPHQRTADTAQLLRPTDPHSLVPSPDQRGRNDEAFPLLKLPDELQDMVIDTIMVRDRNSSILPTERAIIRALKPNPELDNVVLLEHLQRLHDYAIKRYEKHIQDFTVTTENEEDFGKLKVKELYKIKHLTLVFSCSNNNGPYRATPRLRSQKVTIACNNFESITLDVRNVRSWLEMNMNPSDLRLPSEYCAGCDGFPILEYCHTRDYLLVFETIMQVSSFGSRVLLKIEPELPEGETEKNRRTLIKGLTTMLGGATSTMTKRTLSCETWCFEKKDGKSFVKAELLPLRTHDMVLRTNRIRASDLYPNGTAYTREFVTQHREPHRDLCPNDDSPRGRPPMFRNDYGHGGLETLTGRVRRTQSRHG